MAGAYALDLNGLGSTNNVKLTTYTGHNGKKYLLLSYYA